MNGVLDRLVVGCGHALTPKSACFVLLSFVLLVGPSIHRLGTMSRLKQFTKRSENPVSFVLAKVRESACSH